MTELTTKKFTASGFANLPRNADGDIVNLYDVFFRLTLRQVSRLTEDDYSRVDEYEEELRCMAAEFD